MVLAHQTAFAARTDLATFGANALLLFALELRFGMEDVSTIAADAITDGFDDKKCDLVYVDSDAGYAVIAQGYMAADNARPAAPVNKASDLNTAAAWLLNRPVAELPERLRPAALQLRAALDAGSVKVIHFWYVHNLPESVNVQNELRTVELTVQNALTAYPGAEVQEISAIEVGQQTLEEWYQALEKPILVTANFDIPIPGYYKITGGDWQAFATSIPATWLYNVYQVHKSKLFSANVRGYLGSRQSDSNINYRIKKTVHEDPRHFWPYNNGLTVLVHDAKVVKAADKTLLQIRGLSIVNGAQTTGAIGSLDRPPDSSAMIQARFVKCESPDTIEEIIRFNNSQNQVEPSDFRSNDAVQRRLREEFKGIPRAQYFGGRRGGHEDRIRRPQGLIPSDTAAQALAAFHQNPVIAYNQKSEIWTSNNLYSDYFSEKTHAVHIVFAYSLLRAVEAKKLSLVAEAKAGPVSESATEQLTFLRNRGATFLLTAAIARCLETIIGRPVPNPFRASFGSSVSPEFAQTYWAPIVEATIPFCSTLMPAAHNGLKSNDEVARVLPAFRNLVEATKRANAPDFNRFAAHVVLN